MQKRKDAIGQGCNRENILKGNRERLQQGEAAIGKGK